MNMKEVLCMFMTTVIKCHSLTYVIFNAKMTLFDLGGSRGLMVRESDL